MATNTHHHDRNLREVTTELRATVLRKQRLRAINEAIDSVGESLRTLRRLRREMTE